MLEGWAGAYWQGGLEGLGEEGRTGGGGAGRRRAGGSVVYFQSLSRGEDCFSDSESLLPMALTTAGWNRVRLHVGHLEHRCHHAGMWTAQTYRSLPPAFSLGAGSPPHPRRKQEEPLGIQLRRLPLQTKESQAFPPGAHQSKLPDKQGPPCQARGCSRSSFQAWDTAYPAAQRKQRDGLPRWEWRARGRP